MQAKEALIRILADGKFYSGEALGEMLGLSRSAVWKHMQSLKDYQLEVHAVSGKGYRLADPIELLDKNEILRNMPAFHQFPEIEILLETDSTNRYLLDKGKVAAQPRIVCFSEYQHSGRGRRGRQWVSPFGSNLYCSVLWQSMSPLHALSSIGLVVGIGLCKALASLGLEGQRLKWPNDLYWQDRKMAGILIEAAGEIAGPSVMVIGVGLNVRMPSLIEREIDQPWVDLTTALGRSVPRNKLAGIFLRELLSNLDLYEKHGFDYFIEQWHQFDLLRDKSVCVLCGDTSVTGQAEGVDASGALLVRHENGKIKRYFSGEVSVRYDV